MIHMDIKKIVSNVKNDIKISSSGSLNYLKIFLIIFLIILLIIV